MLIGRGSNFLSLLRHQSDNQFVAYLEFIFLILLPHGVVTCFVFFQEQNTRKEALQVQAKVIRLPKDIKNTVGSQIFGSQILLTDPDDQLPAVTS